jgi:hypothetical protein
MTVKLIWMLFAAPANDAEAGAPLEQARDELAWDVRLKQSELALKDQHPSIFKDAECRINDHVRPETLT